MNEKKLYEVEHSYSCVENNYFSNDYYIEHGGFNEFLEYFAMDFFIYI